MDHEIYMRRCLHLAACGGGYVHPNPLVGAVIVNDNRVIGEGFHQKFGAPHAEVNAIESVEDKALLKNSRLYVSLEPCAHYGKTPPCTELIQKHGIKQVYIGTLDPNPLVAGKGFSFLKKHGISVVTGLLEKESQELNRRFFTYHKFKRPYVQLKWAQSADGFIGKSTEKGNPLVISNGTSSRLVHKWRSEEHAILVGARTALFDNPLLDSRKWGPPDPVRIVIDPELKLPATLKFFRKKGKAIVLNTVKNERSGNIVYKRLEPGEPKAASILSALYDEGLVSVLVEGGRVTLDAFLTAGLWDECRVFKSAIMISKGVSAPSLPDAGNQVSLQDINGDQLLTFRNQVNSAV